MSDDNRVHCKFCDWSTLRFYKKTSAFARLQAHVIDNHMDEYEAVEDRLDAEYEEYEEGEKELDFLM